MIRIQSRSAVIPDNSLPYWRGYAGFLSGFEKDFAFSLSDLAFYDELQLSIENEEWLKIYFALGPCLFDKMVRNFFQQANHLKRLSKEAQASLEIY